MMDAVLESADVSAVPKFAAHKPVRGVALLSLILFSVALGCGKKPPEFGQVEGTIRVKGQPHTGLLIRFLPDPSKGNNSPINSTGTSDAQGKFSLEHIYDDKVSAGVPVGWHRVVVEDRSRGPTPQGQTPPPSVIPVEYSSPGSTPLFQEVKLGTQTVELSIGK